MDSNSFTLVKVGKGAFAARDKRTGKAITSHVIMAVGNGHYGVREWNADNWIPLPRGGFTDTKEIAKVHLLTVAGKLAA